MPSFCAVFNCSNRADREKGNSNYCFPSVVKNNGKEVLKFSKVRRELGPQVSESPTNITNFYDPTNFEHKFHEMRT